MDDSFFVRISCHFASFELHLIKAVFFYNGLNH